MPLFTTGPISSSSLCNLRRRRRLRLHVFELVDSALGVALSDLSQGLVLVAPLSDILLVDAIHGRLAGLVPRVSQVLLERPQLALEPLVALGQSQALVDRILDVILKKTICMTLTDKP